jgi:hypothetical protein
MTSVYETGSILYLLGFNVGIPLLQLDINGDGAVDMADAILARKEEGR